MPSDFHLRCAHPQDVVPIHQLFCIPKVYKYLADGQEPPPNIAAEWVDSSTTDEIERGGGLWVLVSREKPIGGLVRLSGDDQGERELTYLLHPSLWGQGLATRMAHTVMSNAFATGYVSTIWAGADKPNVPSIEVMKRLRMTFRRDVQYPAGVGVEYSIHRDVFHPTGIEPLPIS